MADLHLRMKVSHSFGEINNCNQLPNSLVQQLGARSNDRISADDIIGSLLIARFNKKFKLVAKCKIDQVPQISWAIILIV